jgi:hypothetical protein
MKGIGALEVQLMVDAWNGHNGTGTAVRVLLDDGSFRKSRTRSDAWIASGKPLVSVFGIGGGYSLYRVAVDWED